MCHPWAYSPLDGPFMRAVRDGRRGASRAVIRYRPGMAGSSTATWRNWAGTESATPREIMIPRSSGEVQAAVRRAGETGLTVRMTGSAHSFTGAAVCDGLMLRPSGLRQIRSVDAGAGLVTV